MDVRLPGGGVVTITLVHKINQMFVIRSRRDKIAQVSEVDLPLNEVLAAHYFFNKLGEEIEASQTTSSSLIANTQSLPVVSPLLSPLLFSLLLSQYETSPQRHWEKMGKKGIQQL